MDDLTFEDKISLLVLAKDQKAKAELIHRWSNDKQFYTGFYARTMSLDKYMELKKEKFRVVANRAAQLRGQMKNKGWTDKKYHKYFAELPEDLFLERPEFSSLLDRKVRDKNIRQFLIKYPQFKVDS